MIDVKKAKIISEEALYNTDEDDNRVKSKVLLSLNNTHGVIDCGKTILIKQVGLQYLVNESNKLCCC